MILHRLTATFVALLSGVSVQAFEVLFVPQDHATIGEAIEASSNGDIIQVGPGVFQENLHITDKRITIRGWWPGEPTIIDGGSPSISDFGSCIVVSGSSNLVLDSLVLRNGTGSSIYGITRGGGIYSEFATVEIVDVTIENCSVELEPFGSSSWGGAICNYFGTMVVESCQMKNNHSDGQGGAIWSSHGDLFISRSAICDNTAFAGGGIFVQSTETSIDLTSLNNNVSESTGGAVLSVEESELAIYNCTFDSNSATDGSGVWTSVPEGIIANSTFSRSNSNGEGATVRLDDLNLVGTSYRINANTFCGSNGTDIIGDWQEDEPNTFEETCPALADLDRNGRVDGADLTILLGLWGTDGSGYLADLDCTGFVGGGDLTILLGAWDS